MDIQTFIPLLCIMHLGTHVHGYVTMTTEPKGRISSMHIQWNLKQDTSSALRTFATTSLMDCSRKCNRRESCKAMSYDRLRRYCVLHNASDIARVPMKTSGWMYSEKGLWTSRYYRSHCVNCSEQVCDLSTFTCWFIECGTPRPHENSYIRGNMVATSNKVMHVCMNDETVTAVSRCQTTGQWSATELRCSVECTQLPIVHGGIFVPTEGFKEGAVGRATCNSLGARSFVDAAICQFTGNWNITEFVCWSRVYGNLGGRPKTVWNPFYMEYWNVGPDGLIRADSSTPTWLQFSLQTDGTYKIDTEHGYVCDGYGTETVLLHIRWGCPSLARLHFNVYYNLQRDLYTILSMETDKPVRLDAHHRIRTGSGDVELARIEFDII